MGRLTQAYFDALKLSEQYVTKFDEKRFAELGADYQKHIRQPGGYSKPWPHQKEYNELYQAQQTNGTRIIYTATRACGCGEIHIPYAMTNYKGEQQEAMVARALRYNVHPNFNIYQAAYSDIYAQFLDLLKKFGAVTLAQYPNYNHPIPGGPRLCYIMGWPGTKMQEKNPEFFDSIVEDFGDFRLQLPKKKAEKKAA